MIKQGGAPRRLPDDAALVELLSADAFYAEIARRFAVTDRAVRKHARRLGFDPIRPGTRQGNRQQGPVDCAA